MDRFVKLIKGANCTKIVLTNERHRKSLNLLNHVSSVTENVYNVKSEVSAELNYCVEKLENCNNCEVKCNSCMICIHSYNCSCIDYKIRANMCKHIHAVNLFQNNSKEALQPKPEQQVIQEIIQSDSFKNLNLTANVTLDNEELKGKLKYCLGLLDNKALTSKLSYK